MRSHRARVHPVGPTVPDAVRVRGVEVVNGLPHTV